MGLWMSLWDEEAVLIDQCPSGTPLWPALIQHSKHCWNRLRQLVRRSAADGPLLHDIDPGGAAVAIVIPLSYRQRVAGAVVVCALTPTWDDEESRARFSSALGVDRLVFERLAADLPRYSARHLHGVKDILANHIESLSVGQLAFSDVQDLSSHLAQAYEELNLIYRISAAMTVSEPAAVQFEKLCAELTQATVVESVAAILESSEEATSDPIVVTSGPLRTTHDQILRLYRQLRDRLPDGRGPLVINNAAEEPAYAWASDWLERFGFFELTRKEHLFGGILAINQVERTDFRSDEIRLIDAVVERSAAFLESARLYDDLEQLFMGMLHALVSSIDAKDPYTCGHSQRVAWLSRHIASLAGVPDAQCQRIYLSGLLHDVGKIGVSESVLRKTGRLTEEEFDEMKRHPEIGARILEGVRRVHDLIPGVLYHHERIDGKGYPANLKGDEIPFFGRVICLADSFDAMTTDRTYRQARPIPIAAAEIRRCAGTQFDPELAQLLLEDDMADVLTRMTRIGEQSIRDMTSTTGHAPAAP